jgi:hypothetical protein
MHRIRWILKISMFVTPRRDLLGLCLIAIGKISSQRRLAKCTEDVFFLNFEGIVTTIEDRRQATSVQFVNLRDGLRGF